MDEELLYPSTGLVYATDYTATFTERSLVDRIYVDGEMSMALMLQKIKNDEYNAYNESVIKFAYGE